MSLLECTGVTKYFGGLAALHQVDLQVSAGEIVGLIGPNGSGKTTLFNLITGLYSISRGTIRLRGKGSAASNLSRSVRRESAGPFRSPNPLPA